MTDHTDRRDFLLKGGIWAGGVGLAIQGTASLRSLIPNVSYDAPTTVKLGPPAEFPDGLKFLPDQRLFVFREGNVFHAVSAVCTHLGCIVKWNESSHEFDCPCHGARFDRTGKVLAGPPPAPLPQYAVSVVEGEVIVSAQK